MPDLTAPTTVSNLSTGLLSAMRRAWRWVALATVIGLVVGAAVTQLRPVEYRATARLVLASPGEVTVFGTSPVDGDPVRHLQTQLERLRQDDVLLRGAELAGADTSADELRERLDVRISPVSDTLTFTVGHADPETAARLADGVALALRESIDADASSRADRIRAELEALEATYQARVDQTQAALDALPNGVDPTPLTTQRDLAVAELHEARVAAEEVQVDTALLAGGASQLQAAEVPESPATLGWLLGGLLGGLAALLVAALVAWWWSERHPQVRSPRDPEYLLGLPLLGTAPATAGPRNGHLSSSVAARATYETLALQPRSAEAQRILCTSVRPFEGAAVATLQLAVAAAATGRPTALVDADPDGPSMTDLIVASRSGRHPQAVTVSGSGATSQLPVDGGQLLTYATIDWAAGDGAARARLAALLDDLLASGHQVLIHGPAVSSVRFRRAVTGLVDATVVHVADRTAVADLVTAWRSLGSVSACGYVWVAGRNPAGPRAAHPPTTRTAPAPRRELDPA